MGIRFRCQACSNKVNVKDFLAGKRGICPKCGAKFTIPEQSEPEFLSTPDEAEPDTVPAQAAAPAAVSPAIVVTAPSSPVSVMPAIAPITAAPHYPAPQASPFVPAVSAPTMPAPTMPSPGFPAAPLAGPRDPFQEVPTAQWYVRHASGQQYGPAPAATMQKWLNEGRVPGDGMVWREGWSDWLVASLVFPQLSAPPAPLARGPVAAPFAPVPGMFPAPAPAAPATAVNDPFAFSTAPTSGTSSPASQFIHQRRDNSKLMLIISIVLLFAIALVGGILFYVLTKPQDGDEEVVRRWNDRYSIEMTEIFL